MLQLLQRFVSGLLQPLQLLLQGTEGTRTCAPLRLKARAGWSGISPEEAKGVLEQSGGGDVL